jgi:REP element-mobilizing transposase RayT
VEALPGLIFSSLERSKGDAVLLDLNQASLVARQLEESARFRDWTLLAGSVMANHVHVVLGVPGDPSPAKLLQILKSYSSRALNERYSRPTSGTWWTASGSTRKLSDDVAITAAVRYVREQDYLLARCEETAPEVSANRTRGTSVPRWPEEESGGVPRSPAGKSADILRSPVDTGFIPRDESHS